MYDFKLTFCVEIHSDDFLSFPTRMDLTLKEKCWLYFFVKILSLFEISFVVGLE
jgi:hypothetical protein